MDKPFEKLLNIMKDYPELYATDDIPFWDDEHISKNMLAAHLNPVWEAASRPHRFIHDSAVWIDKLCSDNCKGKRLLDLGCGPGLYAEEFCGCGLSVTGIDFSKRSIAYAKESAIKQNKDIEYFYMNYLDIDYCNEFDVVTLIYCDFGVLPPKDRALLLNKAYRALNNNGIMVLDGYTPIHAETFAETETMSYNEGGFWSAEPHLCFDRSRLYCETANTLDQSVVVTATDCRCYNIWNQMFSEDLITNELSAAGFSRVDLFDDVSGKAYTGTIDTFCAVARKIN